MARLWLRVGGVLVAGVLVCAGWSGRTEARSLDKEGDLKLGVRVYTAARIGSEDTDLTVERSGNIVTRRKGTFPQSPAGHLRQHRTFIEAEFAHDLKRLMREGFGPLSLIDDLPFDVSMLRYRLVYRGEMEGVFDYGPSEFRTGDPFRAIEPSFGLSVDVGAQRNRLRDVGSQRHRLFQAFVDVQVEDLFLRIGRQILAWGETDAFRLIDNINPLDSSFGGFLISLDERRVPLDMLRANYYIGTVGPFSEMFVEAFGAIDDEVGFAPGIPPGSPWGLPNTARPNPAVNTIIKNQPQRTFEDIRGGGQVKFNADVPMIGFATFGFAHYYTYFDTPLVQTFVRPTFPVGAQFTEPPHIFANPQRYLVRAEQTPQRVQVTGATSTFVIPAQFSRAIGLGGEPVIRLEGAYFRDEPRFSQFQLDPFVYTAISNPCPEGLAFQVEGPEGTECTGGTRTGDSWNFVMGVDMNQYIRWLNPRNSFFFSFQFFYKHLNGAVKRQVRRAASSPNPDDPDPFEVLDGEVLPVAEEVIQPKTFTAANAVQNIFVHQPVDQYLNTLLISTAYFSGRINPTATFFYDWSGAFAFVPGVTYIHDPFRFTMQYNFLEAGRLKGASGVSLLRDRDNVLFQLEYVI